ncbi:MAG: phosphoribosylaminoimidazolesuccinocarboxamide synthase [Kistimonas sp.]|nr:phosphoribosylaminoimidazolesuccinocarboxamide synthase [Kistimonas sp.]
MASCPPASKVLAVNNDLPIRTQAPVHNGKVRSVYWLTQEDSRRLIAEKDYNLAADTTLGIMVISDRISAFDCIWQGADGMHGVPGKGAALNAVSAHWFRQFQAAGLADNHIVDSPHPLVWIVQKARPLLIEAIGRQYITGSLWRHYEAGERRVCGIDLPDGLEKNQKLPQLLITPSTKGVLEGIPGVPALDDTNISRRTIEENFTDFHFEQRSDIERYEKLLSEGVALISEQLAALDLIFVDTKFEFGYVTDAQGQEQLIYMDEVGTPDSSRIWDGASWRAGKVVENSKESFRQLLLEHFPRAILLEPQHMEERRRLAASQPLPTSVLLHMSEIYCNLAERITGVPLVLPKSPREEIIQLLTDYGLVHK